MRAEVQFSVDANVCLDTLQKSKSATPVPIDAIDFVTLISGLSHGHATSNLEPMRVVRDGRIHVAARPAGRTDFAERGKTVAPVGVQLKIPTVVFGSWSAQ